METTIVITPDISDSNAVEEIDRAYHDLDEIKQESHNIPMGSQEFQKALLDCDQETDEEDQFRQRSHTIDSTYNKRHLSVHFSSQLVTTVPERRMSHEEIHPKSILRHVQEEGRARRNTLDSTYGSHKKFFTKPGSPNINFDHLHKKSSQDDVHQHSKKSAPLKQTNFSDKKVHQPPQRRHSVDHPRHCSSQSQVQRKQSESRTYQSVKQH